MNPEALWIIGLAVVAFLLFFFEIFLPGGVLAMIGMLLLLTASIITGTEYGLPAAVLLMLVSVSAAVVMFFLEVRLLQSGPFAKFFLHQSSNQAVSNMPAGDASLRGKRGTVLTKMTPSGKIQVDERVYEASSMSGMLEPGDDVEVVRIDSFQLVVRKV